MKKGEYTYASGNVYTGKFDETGAMNDEEATITYGSGNVYEGEVQDGLMSGKGKFTWAEENYDNEATAELVPGDDEDQEAYEERVKEAYQKAWEEDGLED